MVGIIIGIILTIVNIIVILNYKKVSIQIFKKDLDSFVERIMDAQQRATEAEGTLRQHETKIQILEGYEEAKEKRLQEVDEEIRKKVEYLQAKREEELEGDVHKILLQEKDIDDIKKIEIFKVNLSSPVIMSKLIWSTYIQKPASAMISRVLGTEKEKICGIYEITNDLTGESYVGQSVDIATRWTAHIKCGLGIEASSTNKLYTAMQRDGVWNFSFRVLEICSKAELNEKEKSWIKLLQTVEHGYNIQSGGSKK